MLRELGFQVAEAGDGQQGLAHLETSAVPEVILVDWNMPQMNGLEFVRAARQQERLQNVPIIMVTSETEMERVSLALDAGANEYVMKPFLQEIIADKLRLLGVLPCEVIHA
jgi:two-component system chemotaxis response regulator CheY